MCAIAREGAHNSQRFAYPAHAFCRLKHFTLLGYAVDQIADKNQTATPVAKNAIVVAIVHFMQQAPRCLRVPMDLPNDIVIGEHGLSFFLRQNLHALLRVATGRYTLTST